ncbi:MAG: leucyl/phenylalanyl-tRNA--protein transferase [Phycisphaerales bacterium]
MHPKHPDPETIVQGLLDAYRRGVFPMADGTRGPINWFFADPRGILPLNTPGALHIPKRLQRTINQQRFTLTCDKAFPQVIRNCAPARSAVDGVWLSRQLIDWYNHLHSAGYAHSIEAWRTDARTDETALVAGVYGVALGAAFFAESMFNIPRPRQPDGARHPLDGTDASKVCLITLIHHLERCGFELFDTQMTTDHVATFGGHEIPITRFLPLLDRAVSQPDRWRPPDNLPTQRDAH